MAPIELRRRTRRAGASLLALGLILTVLGLMPQTATADDDLDGFEDKNFTVDGTRTYDADANQTTFTFVFDGDEDESASHVLIVACIPNATVVSATGPEGATKKNDQPAKDGSTDDHVGIKFEPGVYGTYRIVYSGNLGSADFVVKKGPGHKHFTTGSNPCQPGETPTTETPTTLAPTTTEGTTPTTVAPTTVAPTTVAPTTAPPTTAGPAVLGLVVQGTTTTAAPGVSVLGVQQSRALAATGAETRPLLLVAGFLLAMGGAALLAARPQPLAATAGRGMSHASVARLLTVARMALSVPDENRRRRP